MFNFRKSTINEDHLRELIGKIKSSQESEQRVAQSLAYLDKCLNRYNHDMKIIKKLHPQGRVLEIGSYPFHFTFFLKKEGYETVGVDLDPSRFNGFLKQNDLRIEKINIEKDPLCFEDESFDFIILNEVFEHLKEPIHALAEINRILKKGGILLLSIPNLYFLPHLAHFLAGKGLISDPFRAFSKPYYLGHMGHVREYSYKEVKVFLDNLGFKVKERHYKQSRLFLTFKRNSYLSAKKEIPIPRLILLPLNLANLLVTSLFPFFRENVVIIAVKEKEVDSLFKVKA